MADDPPWRRRLDEMSWGPSHSKLSNDPVHAKIRKTESFTNVFVQLTWITCAGGNPVDFFLGKAGKKKKRHCSLGRSLSWSRRVEQNKQLAKGEGAAEPLPEKCWRRLVQQPLALRTVRKTECLQDTAWHLTQSLASIVLFVVAVEHCIRCAQLEREIKRCIWSVLCC